MLNETQRRLDGVVRKTSASKAHRVDDDGTSRAGPDGKPADLRPRAVEIADFERVQKRCHSVFMSSQVPRGYHAKSFQAYSSR